MAGTKQATVFAAVEDEFDANAAAEKLRKAMKGVGTDEDAIIDVLLGNNNAQRQQIKQKYKTLYGRELIKDLQADLGGHFETLCLYLMMPADLFDAFCLHRAMVDHGTDEVTLIEILASRSNSEISGIKETFKLLYKQELEEAINHETSGNFERVLVSLLQGDRNDDTQVDDTIVQKDAQELYDAGEGRIGTDESVFTRVLCSASIPHLKAVFEQYKKHDDHDIEAAISSETSGNLEKAFLAIARYVKDPYTYFARCLHETLDGPGTKDVRLMQLIVSHSEVDLQNIKDAYAAMYQKLLSEAISDDTSGDYRKLLLKILQ